MNFFVNRLLDTWESMEKNHVFPDRTKSGDLALLLTKTKLEAPVWRTKGIDPKNEKTFVSQLIYKCAVDFCFRHCDLSHEDYRVEQYNGSEAMARCFYRRFGEGLIKPEEILSIVDSAEESEKFFSGDNLPPLLEERRQHLREVALVLKEYFQGDVWHVLEEAKFRVGDAFAPGLVALLCDKFPLAFGQDKKFNKRAQLFALMYYARARSSEDKLPALREGDSIGPIIDYRIPNALRKLGILNYSKELREKIDRFEIIPKGSEEEFEIRLATLSEVVRISSIMKNLLPAGKQYWTILELDHWLWKEGKSAPYPHHLTPTTDY